MAKSLVEQFFEFNEGPKAEAYRLFDNIRDLLDDDDWEQYDFLTELDDGNDEAFEYLCVKYGENADVDDTAEVITDTAQEIRDCLRHARV